MSHVISTCWHSVGESPAQAAACEVDCIGGNSVKEARAGPEAPLRGHARRCPWLRMVRNQETQWLHSASTAALTHYRVSEKRGTLLTTLQGGVIVHDHFKPYFTLKGVAHALCNAHQLRELKALIDIEKEPWATKVSRLLVNAAKAVRCASEQGQSALAERTSRRIVAVYDAIVLRGLGFHGQQPALGRRPGARGRSAKRPGHNLLVRLRDFKTEVLRFLLDFAVPFTNNQAAQDIRMMKVKMKISGSFRTQAGAEIFATLRSVLSTTRKRGWNPLKTLSNTPASLILALSG